MTQAMKATARAEFVQRFAAWARLSSLYPDNAAGAFELAPCVWSPATSPKPCTGKGM